MRKQTVTSASEFCTNHSYHDRYIPVYKPSGAAAAPFVELYCAGLLYFMKERFIKAEQGEQTLIVSQSWWIDLRQ